MRAGEKMDDERKNILPKIPMREPAGVRFAEIEYDAAPIRENRGEAARLFLTEARKAQQIERRAVDPIRQRFFDMRSLASDRPFARDDSELFYRQAKFMEDYTDDYGGDAKLQMYFPYYQHMGYEQLRVYFTWRTKARHGELAPTYVSYVFLYVYELLSGVGVESPLDGLTKLLEVWKEMLRYAPALEKYMPKWLKDYHVYYELPHCFADFVHEQKMQKYYPDLFMFDEDAENTLEVWNGISDYDIFGSGFYKAGNEQLIRDCFPYVVDGVRELCKGMKINCENLFVYQSGRSRLWFPFKHALFTPRGRQSDRKVDLLGVERYNCKNDRWSAYIPIYYSSREQVVGRILRKMESDLRQKIGYKYKLKSEPCEFYRTSGEPILFDNVVEKAVAVYYRDLTRTVVTVDHENLARIREEALGTQDKLIVYDDFEPSSPAHQPSSFELSSPAHRPSGFEPDAEEQQSSFEPSSPEHRPSSFGPEAEEQQSGFEPSSPEYRRASFEPEPEDFSDDGWSALKAALTETERRALSAALSGGDVKAFADENGIMLEVLADGINEKAADYIGDGILDSGDGISIYDEYRQDIAEMIG